MKYHCRFNNSDDDLHLYSAKTFALPEAAVTYVQRLNAGQTQP